MTEKHYSEDEELTRQHTLKLISEFESRFFHSYVYGALAIAMYLASKIYEPGTLLTIINFLGLISLYMWYATNSWVKKVKIEIYSRLNKPKDISDRYELYAQRAIINGIVSFVAMLIAAWYFI